MAGVGRIEWRRAFPTRAWGRLGWYIALGAEPGQLESGQRNPLALVPAGLAVVAGVVAAPRVVALFRRPMVSADHYALSIRPGILRTLLLPWARIAEIATYGLLDEPFLLVRCGPWEGRLGDRLHWWDRFALRAAIRAQRGEGLDIRAFHVAVRMDDFVGDPAIHLASLAAFAPNHVIVTNRLY